MTKNIFGINNKSNIVVRMYVTTSVNHKPEVCIKEKRKRGHYKTAATKRLTEFFLSIKAYMKSISEFRVHYSKNMPIKVDFH